MTEPSFYNVTFGQYHYEVEAYSEEHALQRALVAYRADMQALGCEVIVQKLTDL